MNVALTSSPCILAMINLRTLPRVSTAYGYCPPRVASPVNCHVHGQACEGFGSLLVVCFKLFYQTGLGLGAAVTSIIVIVIEHAAAPPGVVGSVHPGLQRLSLGQRQRQRRHRSSSQQRAGRGHKHGVKASSSSAWGVFARSRYARDAASLGEIRGRNYCLEIALGEQSRDGWGPRRTPWNVGRKKGLGPIYLMPSLAKRRNGHALRAVTRHTARITYGPGHMVVNVVGIAHVQLVVSLRPSMLWRAPDIWPQYVPSAHCTCPLCLTRIGRQESG